MRGPARCLLLTAAVAALASTAAAQPADRLAADFRSPPASARPRVWWHWMNGNISLDGIDKDLAWMKRVGIAGVQNFDASFGDAQGPFGTPQVVDKRLVFLTPEWRAAFRHAVEKADAQGFEFAIAGSPGWSESGGPWVKPEQAMKKLVWSEIQVQGGRRLAALPAPPAVTGPFQAIPGGGTATAGPIGALPSLYRDVAVVAYRAPAADSPAGPAKVTASSTIEAGSLTDGDLVGSLELPFAPGAESWVLYDYGRAQTLRALRIVAAHAGGFGEFGATAPAGRIEMSRDGQVFEKLADLPVAGAAEQTVAFPAATARYFRVVFLPRQPNPVVEAMGAPTPKSHVLSEMTFETAARVHRFEDKAGWSAAGGLGAQPTPAVSSDATVRRGDVIDLTDKLRADGTLDWTPPPGRWTVLRFGYSLTGRQNHPASVEGTGLEVDKLSARHVTAYADAYLGEYTKSVGPELMGARGVQALITDSWEAGAQNWTEEMFTEFQRRRGYDLRPWLPVLAGRVVDSAQASDAVLWDFRQTLGELVADNHYGALSAALHARGMKRYGESHEAGRAFIGDGMQAKKSADVPMGATWAEMPPTNDPFTYDADVRESASVAHLYGQNLVAAESFTTAGSPFGYDPAKLKPVADRMMANGLNRFILHTSVHQPVDTPGPGVTLAVFGQWFTRKETWAEEAGPWIDYLARSSHLLQQGRFVADVAYFYGEDGNITELYGKKLPDVPAGYAYDFVNADALVNQLQARDGRLVAATGASYRLLVIDPRVRRMTVPVLRKLQALAAAGVTIVGSRPSESPSLADDPAEFRRLAEAVFGASPGPTAALSQALASAGLAPDVDDGGAGLRYVHRATEEGQIYFVSNPTGEAKSAEVSFRTSGQAAEIWRADTGSIVPATYATRAGRTVVPLELAANEALFVVFRSPGPAQRIAPPLQAATVTTLSGPWRITFPAAVKADALKLTNLSSWTDSASPSVRYFSGTATYRTSFTAPAAAVKDRGLLLDLGEVKNLARVSVNGKPVGVAWKSPYQVDVTGAVKAGQNQLEVQVTNLWPNRLIGDKQPGAGPPQAWTIFNPYPATAPLAPSGLLGPVTLRQNR